jgi:hypothetical protein
MGCGFHRCRDGLAIDIGEHGSHALAGQRLRDGAADPVSGTGDQRGLARGIKCIAQQAHVGLPSAHHIGGSCLRTSQASFAAARLPRNSPPVTPPTVSVGIFFGSNRGYALG